MKKDILALKVKIIELTLERDKTINSFLIGATAAIIVFFVNLLIFNPGTALSQVTVPISNALVGIIVPVLACNVILGLILWVIISGFFLLVLPIVSGWLAKRFIDEIVKDKAKAYNDAIKGLNDLIKELE